MTTANPTHETLLDVALSCIARGWHVFPCWPESKKPMTTHGWKDATLDENQVRAWWFRTPTANVAIATGPSNLAVLDIDKGARDMAAATDWMIRNAIGVTYGVRTGRRDGYGLQLYFEGSAQSVGGWEFDGCSGDVKSIGGYVMAAGSIHPDTKEAYEVVINASVYPAPVVVQNLRGRTQDRAVLTDESPITEFRNDTMLRLLGRFRNGGATDEEVETKAHSINETRMAPPLDEAELERIVGNACRYPVGQADPPVMLGGKLAGESSAEVTPEDSESVEPVNWRTRYTTLEQFRDVQPPSFLIQDFLEDGSITALGAPVAQRKSIVVANVIHALLTGEPLFGHFEVVKRPERILYLCPEMGLVDVANRFKKLGLDRFVGDTLFIRTMDDPKLPLTDLDEELPGAVLILDTLTRFVTGNQNDAGDMSKFADLNYAIKRRGATIMLLHHAIKGSGSQSMSLDSALRGSTELAAFVTCVWSTQLQDVDAPHTTPSNLKCVKQRGFASEPFQVSCDENYRMTMLGNMGEVKSQKQASSEAVLAALLKNSPLMGINKLQAAMKAAGHPRGGKWVTQARAAIVRTGVVLT